MLFFLNIAAFVIYMFLSHVCGYYYKSVQYINRDRKENIQWVLPDAKKDFRYHNLAVIVTAVLRIVLLVCGYFVFNLDPILLISAFVLGRFAFINGKQKAREQCSMC